MGALSPGVVHLILSVVPASVSPVPFRCVRLVSFLRTWPLAATLPADVNRPDSQEVFVRNWEPVCSLVGVPALGPRLPLSPPPASCLRGGWAGCLSLSLSLSLSLACKLWVLFIFPPS